MIQGVSFTFHTSLRTLICCIRMYSYSTSMPAPVPIRLSLVLGILRLSHKYDIQYLYRRALDHLAVGGWYRPSFNAPCSNHLTNIESPLPQDLVNSLSIIETAVEVESRSAPNGCFHAPITMSPDIHPENYSRLERTKCIRLCCAD